jgi:hypothetical protein
MKNEALGTDYDAAGRGEEASRGANRQRTFVRMSHYPLVRMTESTMHQVLAGISVTAYAPVLELCRRLVAAGHDPATPLHAFRAHTLCLLIRAIGEAAGLEINSKGTALISRRAVRAASPMRQNRRPVHTPTKLGGAA